MTLNYRTETSDVTAKQMNQNFVRKIENGQIKEAEERGTAFIRDKLREESFARKVIVPEEITSAELDRDENTDDPKKIVDIEPDSVATWVSFKGMGPARYFSGQRYPIYFGKVESARFQKSKFQLMSYNADIRQILADNSVKDMADQEDLSFITRINDILTANPTQVIASASFDGDLFKLGAQNLYSRRMPLGKLLLTKEAHAEALSLQVANVGDDIVSRHYDMGVEGEERLWGMPTITTIKRDILTAQGGATHSIYFFSPENYLGNFFLLQDATLFMKQEADNIFFHTYEALGIGIGNTKGIARVDLTI